ncbi:MAG TPA: glycosyl hydrolase, partial [Polyangiaceae bacterium]|nr:glycosyl hydrolase [Polyangiaceae bacterium]
TPGLWSSDFLFGQDALDNRAKMIATAVTQWNAGAVVQLMYHNCIPTRDETCSWNDIGGTSPQHLTDEQWAQLVTAGTALNQAWLARLDGLSVYFKTLQDAGVAPLFRPLHEMNQPIFWWAGRKGANGTLKLYQITHDYLVKTKGFDNIIWVWDIQDFASLSSDVKDYDPGPDYYDIAALDVYDGGYTTNDYSAMLGAAPGKLIAIGECEHPPTSNELSAQPLWAFFMLWPDFLDENAGTLPALYRAPNVVTEDQMPGWN